MKYLLLTISCFIGFVSCQQESVKNEPTKNITKTYIDTFLDFDEVVHYQHPTLDWDNTIDAQDIPKSSKKEVLLYRIGFSGCGKTLDNIDKVEDLEYVGYTKNILDENQLKLVKFIAHNKNLCKEMYPRQQWEKVEEAKQHSNIIGQSSGIIVLTYPLKYLKQLFSIIQREKIGYSSTSTPTICEPIYRDILFFKKNGQTVGFVKICFDCSVTSKVTLNDHSLYLKRCYIILKGVLDEDIINLEDLK